ncbi:hypothetical protein T01_5136 [Trichinella spiralis]|uniref:Uncharacterized protein n=1 Tax=Trichinella spiralis TaxID=6334 RepID=A0A0V1C0E7_TRISP|nr:hypothetical protein T01_5136 [Trichinella spiralis]
MDRCENLLEMKADFFLVYCLLLVVTMVGKNRCWICKVKKAAILKNDPGHRLTPYTANLYVCLLS